jgi:hypothetical protein
VRQKNSVTMVVSSRGPDRWPPSSVTVADAPVAASRMWMKNGKNVVVEPSGSSRW